MGHHTVAQVARLEGRFADAAEHYRAAIRIAHQFGDAAMLSEPLQGLAAVAIATDDPELGVRLLAANTAIRERLGGGPPPEWLRLGDPLNEARRSLGEEAYRQAWGTGSVMSVEVAVSVTHRRGGRALTFRSYGATESSGTVLARRPADTRSAG